MLKQLYKPKKDLKEVVLELIDMVSGIAWEQASRKTSGEDPYKDIMARCIELTDEVHKWGKAKSAIKDSI